MQRGWIKYFALWFFLAGVILIVFLQFVSGVNISRLLQGNNKLLQEVKIQNNLRKLETDVLSLESDIRGIIISGDKVQLPQTSLKISDIEEKMALLKASLDTGKTKHEVLTLDFLVHEKIDISYKILTAYMANGQQAGEGVINKNRGSEIRDSIMAIVYKLDSIRQSQLKGIVGSIENSGNQANKWGLLLAAIACLVCVLTFLYVVNVGRQQQHMILMLNESEKRLKEASSAKEQFLANMSHEIRTPMNAILGFTHLLQRTNLDTQQEQYVNFIHSSGENLLTLINDILDLSKIEAGMMQLENTPFSLNGLVSSIQVMFSEKAKQKGLSFEVKVDDTINDTLNGDAVRLTQILINLLANAIKFTEEGFVQLNVHAVKNNAQEVVLQFCVKDSGIGIAPGKKQNIFDRFQQAEAETTRRFGGTGLGLSIVKQLVELKKGTINVVSELGQGTEFIVTLPFVPIFDYYKPIKQIETRGPVKHLDKKSRILVAEDNSLNQELIRHLMNYWQIEFTLVDNGWAAVDQLRKNSFSLVLMDIQMPEMDGYATTKVIRNELKSDIPIIAMTAHAMAGEKEKCLNFGMNEYISKPIKEAELFKLLQQFTITDPPADKQVNNITPGLVSLHYLQELSMGDKTFEQAILRQFILQVPQELEHLKDAIVNEHFLQVKGIAHGLKSSVAYLGLLDVLHPNLQRMESEAVAKTSDNHFEEDYKKVEEVCLLAIAETGQMLVTAN